jgi:hypothetical protein
LIANRAWVLLPSGRRLDLLNPDPQAWTDHDLAVGLSRTYRWAGYSAWDLPLSVAQHSLTVLAIREVSSGPGLTPPEALCELLHDAEEALLGGWDPSRISDQALTRWFDVCRRPSITATSFLPGRRQATPRTNTLTGSPPARPSTSPAGAGKAMRESLGITLEPLADDPLPIPEGMRAWEPWPPNLAAHLFLTRMNELQTASNRGGVAKGWCHALRR